MESRCDLTIDMKSILAIFAVGLLLATALSGCVGGDNGTGDNNGGIDNGTGNETGNETGNVTLPDNYHEVFEDSMTIADMITNFDHTFKVKDGAKKVTIKFEVSTTIPMDPTTIFTLGITVTGAKETVYDEYVSTGEYTVEVSGKEIGTYGYGTWTISLNSWDVSTTCTSTVDVIYQ